MKKPVISLVRHFSDLADPRIERKKLHKLTDILSITICAVICGAQHWRQVEEFGKAKEHWFRTFLDLANGVPSHDTFGTVFAALDSEAFAVCFIRWVESLATKTGRDVISFDGKALRKSFDSASSKAAIHMVSAFSSANNLVLGQLKVDDKSNEITAVPKLLELLVLEGCIVTADALNCQKSIVSKIVEQDADYVLALKENHPNLYADVKLYFQTHRDRCLSSQARVEKGHGRIETRSYWMETKIDWLYQKKDWRNLKGIGMVESCRELHGETSKELRYYLLSLDNIEEFSRAVREHWHVESAPQAHKKEVYDENELRACA